MTMVSRHNWAALQEKCRGIIARHEGGRMCDRCNEPGDCPRLDWARTYYGQPPPSDQGSEPGS